MKIVYPFAIGSLVIGVLLFREKITYKKIFGTVIGIISTVIIVL